MLRSAAKNHRDVTVLVEPADYAPVLAEMRAGGGAVSPATCARLARKAFQITARYDGAIADYLGRRDGEEHQPFGETIHLALHKAQDLRYGENPHQRAALYGDFFAAVQQLHGKELSYNNIVDINAALWLMREFLADPPTVAILKHNTPCGVGTAATAAGRLHGGLRHRPGIALRRHPHRQPAVDPGAGARSSTRSSPKC